MDNCGLGDSELESWELKFWNPRVQEPRVTALWEGDSVYDSDATHKSNMTEKGPLQRAAPKVIIDNIQLSWVRLLVHVVPDIDASLAIVRIGSL